MYKGIHQIAFIIYYEYILCRYITFPVGNDVMTHIKLLTISLRRTLNCFNQSVILEFLCSPRLSELQQQQQELSGL